jgi:predicted AAA+ superfamily ATPase
VASRHQIRDLKSLKELSSFVLANTSNLISYNKIKNLLGMPLDVVRTYLNYLVEAYLIAENCKFSFKVKEQIKNPKKIYCQDVGLRNAVAFSFSKDLGRIAENLVYTALISKNPGEEVFYYKDKHEVDFLIKGKAGKIKEAIQVCFSNLEDKKVKEREFKGLEEAMSALAISKGTIITDEAEETTKKNQPKIRLIPLWKWLLEV